MNLVEATTEDINNMLARCEQDLIEFATIDQDSSVNYAGSSDWPVWLRDWVSGRLTVPEQTVVTGPRVVRLLTRNDCMVFLMVWYISRLRFGHPAAFLVLIFPHTLHDRCYPLKINFWQCFFC